VSISLPPVSAVADVLALWGADGWLTPPLRPVVAPDGPWLGRARTVELRPGSAGPGMAPLYDLLSTELEGDVVVVSATGVNGAAWGEILATAARGAGVVGVLVDGSVRDGPAMAELGLPVLAADQCVVGPNGLAHVVAIDGPVTIGRTTVAGGDHVLLDATGAVRIRSNDLADVLGAAARYALAEDAVLAALASGVGLDTAYLHKKSIVDELRR
jgi:regulator of RNase E activity RraA